MPKTWIYTSNDPNEMQLVARILNENGIEAEIGEFSDEPELAGELAVLVADERYEDANGIVKVFYEQRDIVRVEAEVRRAWARYGWLVWLALGAGTVAMLQFGPWFVACWGVSVGWVVWLLRRGLSAS